MIERDTHSAEASIDLAKNWDSRDSQAHALEAVAVLQAALDCIIVVAHDSRVLEWNAAAERTFGYSRDEALGHSMPELIIPPDLRSAHHAGLANYLATGAGPVLNQRIEIRGMRRSGDEFPVELTVVPIKSEPPRFAAYLRDITERQRQEEALRRSEERFRSLVEANAEIVWLRSPNGTFHTPQPAWTAFTGMPFEALEGFGWLDAIHPEDRQRVARSWTEAVAAIPELYQIEYRLRRYDGIYRHVSVRAVPVKEADGSVREWVGVSADVTERKEAEAERRNQALQQRRFIREILASVTEGRLCLCESKDDLPSPLPMATETVNLTAESLRLFRRDVQAASAAVQLPQERALDILTAAGEASMNAVRHGGGGMGRVHSQPDSGTIQIWVEDAGTGIREEDLHRATLEKGWSGSGSFGHGFFLMLNTADRTYLLTGPHGTTVVLEQDSMPQPPNWNRAGC